MTEPKNLTAIKRKMAEEGYVLTDAEIEALIASDDFGPYQTLDGKVTESGEAWNDRYIGMKVGSCGENGGEPTMALVNVPLKRDEIEKLGAVSKKDPDSFVLSSDVYEAEQKGPGVGYICWPFRNSLVNDMVMNADCEDLISSADPDDKCMLLKDGISKLSGQPRPKTWPEAIADFIFYDLVKGTLVGMTFIGGGAILDAVFLKGRIRGWIGTKLNNFFKNGKNGGNGGPGGAAPTGGGNDANAVPQLTNMDGFSPSAEFSRALEQIKNSPGIRVMDPSLNSNNVTCWCASFALGAAAYFAAGAIADAGVAVVDITAEGAVVAGRAAVGAASGVGAWYWNVVWGL